MQEALEREISLLIEERENTLNEIERILFSSRYNFSEEHRTILATHAIPMVYASWEGFVRLSFQTYISTLNRLEIEFETFNNNIKVFHMEKQFSQLKDYHKMENVVRKTDFYQKLKEFNASTFCELNLTIKTNSNVKFDTINNILKDFGLESLPEYKDPINFKKTLNALVELRNKIAHGGELEPESPIDKQKYNEYKQFVLNLMYEILIKMLDGLENKTYLSRNP